MYHYRTKFTLQTSEWTTFLNQTNAEHYTLTPKHRWPTLYTVNKCLTTMASNLRCAHEILARAEADRHSHYPGDAGDAGDAGDGVSPYLLNV